MYTLYILRCSDNTLYTGITNNLEKRIKMHNGEIPGGARYTSGRRPVQVVYSEELAGRSEATKREREVKKLRREEKEGLVAGYIKT
ncbi:GIY-YIG nuclease family protein [Candidatus Gracilibacteria bacterium]|nr:GIY-YIG nuclease family protein [Candidatus Gracilibacteria bacterium]